MEYNKIEKKWQDYWDKNNSFKTIDGDKTKEPYYILVEFPYPSGNGLHVGHVRSYTAQDALARMKRMQGYNVLYPMGFDAFGAPAEQYAIKNHIHPKDAVKENIKTFKGQMKSLGFSFDWSREFSTTDPDYYKWTQWQFLQFYKHGMAYKATTPVNWCNHCKTVLSNEDSAGGVCERCGNVVVQKEKSQWMLRMSDYAEDLLDGLNDTNFASKVKVGQINWIGKSIGANVNFKIDGSDKYFTVYTTRCDTLYGATYCVLSPEHPLVLEITTEDKMNEVVKYKEDCSKKNDMERTSNKDKTGVFTGAYAINPINEEKIPIYISDYVLSTYGTGAIMAVAAHDERDYEFALKFNIDIRQVMAPLFVKSKYKNGLETINKNIVNIVIRNNKKEYLCEKEDSGVKFISGEMFDGEDPISATKRILESKIDVKYNVEKVLDFIYFNDYSDSFNHRDKCYTLLCSINEYNGNDFVFVKEDDLINNINNDGNKYDALRVINGESAMVEDGIHINSNDLDGLDKDEAIEKVINYLTVNKCGEKKINYKMRDWIFSRQRFWGEPIPMIYCDDCGWQAMDEKELPLLLPDVAEYEPTDNGESPLAKIEDWVNTTCPKCGKKAKRETDTMPNWAGSSWYFLRFMDPHNDKEFASMDNMKYYNKVNWYNGGMEHTARHLLYARFWVQFLYNIGLVPNKEMIDTRVSHGMVLGSNNEKMSKSRGNVINPDDIVKEFGADTLRVYEMFMGDYEQDAPWSTDSLKGCKRFLDKVIRLKEKVIDKDDYSNNLEIIINKSIKKIEYDLTHMAYNTAVSTLMILVNAYESENEITKADYRLLLTLLNPIAPHITEELNEELGFKPLCETSWPIYDEDKTIDKEVEIGVQVNGKIRGSIKIRIDEEEESVKQKALNHENVKKHIEGKEIVKVLVIKNRIVTIVIK